MPSRSLRSLFPAGVPFLLTLPALGAELGPVPLIFVGDVALMRTPSKGWRKSR